MKVWSWSRGEQVPANLAAARARARETRMKANRSLSCAACQVPSGTPVDTPDSSGISSLLQLQRQQAQMF
jgi:hypothetical protein